MSNDPYTKTNPNTGVRKIAPTVEHTPPDEKSEPWKPHVSEETLKGLSALAEDFAKQQEEDPPAEEPEEPDKVYLGDVPASTYTSVFYRNTPIDNPETRQSIEERCKELNLSHLLLYERVRQHVPILPEDLVVEYQSLTTADGLWMETKAASIHTNEFEARTWVGYARLTASIITINREPLAEHVNDKGRIDEKKFLEKMEILLGKSERLIEVLLVNQVWFEDRVGQLFDDNFKKIKNG